MGITFLQFMLIGIIYFFGSSTSWTFGVGYFTLYRPVFSGLLVGLLFGEPIVGMVAGATVNIVYLNFVSTGGTLKGDPCLASIVATVLSIKFGLHHLGAVAFAYPLGLIGIIFLRLRMTFNIRFAKKVTSDLNNHKLPKLFLYNVLYPQIALLIFSLVTSFIMIYISNNLFNTLRNLFIEFDAILYISGILLLSLSVAINMNNINNQFSLAVFALVFWAFKIFSINSDLIIICLFVLSIIYILFGRRLIKDEK